MQLYALDDKHPILATEAIKQKNYRCPECLTFVRPRGGPHRQPHFYHLRSHPSCRQYQKSLPHIQLQLHLKSLIPNSSLEKSFSKIGRIADVAWEEKWIVFEIQCSPISHEEAKSRCEDYALLGYTVVWILSDRRFNKKNLSLAENFLRGRLCYFARGTEIYDQFEVIQNMKRSFRGPRLPIDPRIPVISKLGEITTFEGALINRLTKNPKNTPPKPLEKRWNSKRRFSFKQAYKFYFQALLERFFTS